MMLTQQMDRFQTGCKISGSAAAPCRFICRGSSIGVFISSRRGGVQPEKAGPWKLHNYHLAQTHFIEIGPTIYREAEPPVPVIVDPIDPEPSLVDPTSVASALLF